MEDRRRGGVKGGGETRARLRWWREEERVSDGRMWSRDRNVMWSGGGGGSGGGGVITWLNQDL